MSMVSKFSAVISPTVFFTPGMNRIGTGHTSSSSTSLLPLANSPAPAGAGT